jgi:hypothetical protein
VPLAYYRRLSRRDKATYRKSDALASPVLSAPEALAGAVEDVRRALERDDVRATQVATTQLLRGLVEQLGAPPVSVRVLAKRPGNDYGELHGLYEAEEGRRPIIRVWMRTNVRRQPVALRTFVRTLLHELCHHLDFWLYELEESFHTEGFFRREAALARQLLGPSERPPPKPKPEPKRTRKAKPGEAQLELALATAPAARRR